MGFRDRVRRADRALGRLYWGAVTLICSAFALGTFWLGFSAVDALDGGERWAVLAVAVGFGSLLVYAAWTASQRSRLSEWLDDQ